MHHMLERHSCSGCPGDLRAIALLGLPLGTDANRLSGTSAGPYEVGAWSLLATDSFTALRGRTGTARRWVRG